ncbi:hypothetical protein NC653_017807 [Populus alba x Populus x berolinensis]|uniref:Serine-rich protein-like protein n=1 Tax=Populus alba x Populus x berolinensis TaxID=444605 RepID=A0AAD6W1H0_9ROSI|nr:hypothetical protein NC653_017807 [Populus alba x Populus x berolinensis]
MAAGSSRSKRSSGPVLRSLSPSGRLQTHNNYSLSSSSSSSSASAFASSTSLSFYSPPSAFFQNSHQRSASPTRVNLYSSCPPLSPSFRFSIDRSTSPNRSISVSKKNHSHPISAPKRTCMCSPTTHRGSFRCSLHKNSSSSSNPAMFTPHRLNMRRSAMTNSLVRIGGVEGEWVKRALTALIRPSSHQQRRRGAFQPRQSRLSIMSKAGVHSCVNSLWTTSDRRGGHCCIDLRRRYICRLPPFRSLIALARYSSPVTCAVTIHQLRRVWSEVWIRRGVLAGTSKFLKI